MKNPTRRHNQCSRGHPESLFHLKTGILGQFHNFHIIPQITQIPQSLPNISILQSPERYNLPSQLKTSRPEKTPEIFSLETE